MSGRAHGTYARYRLGERGQDWRNGCRCSECSHAGVLYEKRRAARKARGWEPFVDASEAARHLEFLSSRNVGARAVAEATGVSRSQLQRIKSGKVTRCRQETVDRILAMHVRRGRGQTRMPVGPTLALIEDMRANGITRRAIAAALGVNELQICKGETVNLATAERVAAVHARLMAPVLARRRYDAERRRTERRKAAS